MDLWMICVCWTDKPSFPSFVSTASSFSSQYLFLFLKSSRSCVLLLFTPFTSVICPSVASWRRQFLLRIGPIQLAFLWRILFRSVLFSPIRSRTCSLVSFSDHFTFSILLLLFFGKRNSVFIPVFMISLLMYFLFQYSLFSYNILIVFNSVTWWFAINLFFIKVHEIWYDQYIISATLWKAAIFNTFKCHVSCTDGKIPVKINLLFYLFFTDMGRRWKIDKTVN